MKKIFLTLILSALPLFCMAQERLAVMSRPDDNAPEYIRGANLYGKTLVIFGDSYVQNHVRPIEETWHYKLAAKYNMEYHNFGWNGNCVAYDRTAENFGPPMYERFRVLPEKADYVIICAGHNDATQMNRRGEGTDFFREKLNILCQELIAKYPSAKLCFVTPWRVPRPMFPEMTAVLLEVCGSYSIPVFDATTQSGIYVWDEAFRTLYFQHPGDTAHLNAAGHDLFLPKMEHFLLGL
ncbi:MAG: SGNH/GDSL hydrolase family protein [Bacteroidales bacterium]|nr:SGNH/GDSL hydrolase family protein [Bacteroidales bacterium]